MEKRTHSTHHFLRSEVDPGLSVQSMRHFSQPASGSFPPYQPVPQVAGSGFEPVSTDQEDLSDQTTQTLTNDREKMDISQKRPAVVAHPGRKRWNIALPGRPFQRFLVLAGGSIVLLFLTLVGLVAYNMLETVHNVTAYHVGRQQQALQMIAGYGNVVPGRQLDIKYPAGVRVLDVLVKVGDQVKIGQPLLKIDPKQLTQAHADVDAAQSFYNSTLGSNPAAAPAAKHALDEAQNRLQALQDQSLNSDGDLLSSMAGTVTAINVVPGALSAAATPLVSIADTSSMSVLANINLQYITQLHAGMAVQVQPTALWNSTPIQGSITAVIPRADPKSDTFQAQIQITNPPPTLISNMSVNVAIQVPVRSLVVPRLAVLNPDNESSVFVIRNGHAYIQPVHVIGQSNDTNFYFVDAGIKTNDTLILLPLNRIREGQAVTIVKTES